MEPRAGMAAENIRWRLLGVVATLSSLVLGGCDIDLENLEDEARAGTVDDSTPFVINEVAAAGQPRDWFELYNPGVGDIDLSRFYFTDDIAGRPRRGRFPTGARLPAGGYYVQTLGRGFPGFKLGSGEQLAIYSPEGERIDWVDWAEGDSPRGHSYGRIPNGTGDFVTLWVPTAGTDNRPREPLTTISQTPTRRR